MKTWRDVPGWCGEDIRRIYRLAVDRAPDEGARFVELGCWVGKSTCLMGSLIRESGKRIAFDAVDHFQGSPELQDDLRRMLASGRTLRDELESNLAACGVLDLVRIVEADSAVAAASYPPGSLDFMFIDGAHEYESVARDITAWLPAIRFGGLMAGHDWGLPGVQAAVRQFFSDPRVDASCWYAECE